MLETLIEPFPQTSLRPGRFSGAYRKLERQAVHEENQG